VSCGLIHFGGRDVVPTLMSAAHLVVKAKEKGSSAAEGAEAFAV
jgi:hypothetical protein